MTELTFPDVELNIYTPKNPVEATIVENRIVTSEASPNFVRHITFDITGTDLVNRIRVGQSVGVLPPGKNEKGRPHKLRLYSISSPTRGEGGKAHLISTTVKRTIEEFDNRLYLGVASNYLSDLQPGDKVKLTGPSGKRFLLPENPRDYNYLFFATGTGIAPFRGMIQELFEEPYEKSLTLVFGCSYRTDLLYADYFREMEQRHPNFRYITCVSRENRRADGGKQYVQSQLIDNRDYFQPVLQKSNTLVYICGLKGMEEGIYRELLRQGYQDYLEVRGELPESTCQLDSRSFRRLIKPSERIFEEVY